tara:strand:+ start:307 stop:435 length:129 start_codon:yes stop_codon:yes gene_type:complete
MLYHILNFISGISGKISVWSWQKLWGDRDKGIGYKYFRGKNK